MAIDKKVLLQLREQTGAGLSGCQQALEETDNDLEKAIEILRKKGAIKAAKKIAERTAQDGIIDSYIHANGKVGVLIEVACETDFVAKNSEFKELVHELAMQVAAANPLYLSPQDVPDEEIKKEKEIYKEQLKEEGKPDKVVEKIIDGKIEKYYEENCLIKQPYIKDDKVIIEKLIESSIAKLGEKIEVIKFCRFQI